MLLYRKRFTSLKGSSSVKSECPSAAFVLVQSQILAWIYGAGVTSVPAGILNDIAVTPAPDVLAQIYVQERFDRYHQRLINISRMAKGGPGLSAIFIPYGRLFAIVTAVAKHSVSSGFGFDFGCLVCLCCVSVSWEPSLWLVFLCFGVAKFSIIFPSYQNSIE